MRTWLDPGIQIISWCYWYSYTRRQWDPSIQIISWCYSSLRLLRDETDVKKGECQDIWLAGWMCSPDNASQPTKARGSNTKEGMQPVGGIEEQINQMACGRLLLLHYFIYPKFLDGCPRFQFSNPTLLLMLLSILALAIHLLI
jgi:hypothetical protein